MIVMAALESYVPQMTRYAVDTLVPILGKEGIEARIALFLGKFAGLALAQGILIWLFILIAGSIEVRIVHNLRERGFARLQELSFSYYDRTPAGWIISRMTSDAQKLGDTIAWGIVDLVWGSAIMISISVYMLVMNWRLGLFALAFMPVLLAATIWFQMRILQNQRKARRANSLLTGMFSEGLQGARTSKTLVLESGNKAEFAEESGRLRGFAVRAARLSALYMPLVILLASSGTALVLGAGGRLVMDGLLSYGELIAFIAYTMMIFDPAREVARVLSEFQAAQASAERLVSLIETEPEIVDLPNARAEGSFSGEIRFDNVSFEYGDGTWIFRDFSLVIPAGQTVALVGETGSGKSTFVNLICRFYEPVSGRILVDGTDYREYTQNWLHRKLGYVLQTPQLFSGTIRENIRYGRLDATDKEIEDAAQGANALGFIRELEFGFDTRVGEGGALLSTGQKQLISLARALVCNPTLMILDEATSSVDTETEVLVQDAINTVLKGRTSIVIAHRLSTIRNADRILVMEDGEVLEDGSHDELMAARGRYHSLYTRQFLDESLDVSVQTD
jgi:ATP-binding cassette subfamily B protein